MENRANLVAESQAKKELLSPFFFKAKKERLNLFS